MEVLTKTEKDILHDLLDMEKRGDLEQIRFSDLPIKIYHHPDCPGVSSTQLKSVFERSVMHINHGSKAFSFGNAFHCWNNEPEVFRESYHVVPTESKRSREWLSAKKANGGVKELLSQPEFDQILAMSNCLWDHPEAGPLLKGATFEETFFSRDYETGILKKCRVDAMNGLTVSDLKTTENAAPIPFSYDARKYLYRISAAYYLEIVSEVIGQLCSDFRLIACEKSDPWGVAVYKVDQHSVEQGTIEIRETLQKIQNCNDGKAWKGYPLNQTIHI